MACTPNAPVVEPPPTDTSVPPDTASCEESVPAPVAFTTHTGFTTAEDFEITPDGRFVSLMPSGNLIALVDGVAELIAPAVTDEGACTRVLPSGDFVVCDREDTTVHLVDGETGAKSVFASGLAFPNGAVVDASGTVYVSELAGGRVVAIPAAGATPVVLATGLSSPNGLALSVDEQRLYVAGFGDGTLHVLERVADGWGPAVLHGAREGSRFDALAVDACGRAYAGDWQTGALWRFPPEGGEPELLAEVPSVWTPAMRWGVGTPEWPSTSLFVSDRDLGRLFELSLDTTGHRPVGALP